MIYGLDLDLQEEQKRLNRHFIIIIIIFFLKLRIYKIYQLNTTIIRLTKLGNVQLAVRYTKQA